MKDIKKLMITLVALLAVTTGAWAQDADYDINVNFAPYYDPVRTHFNGMIMNPMDPSAEIKGTLDLVVDGVSKGSFTVDGEMFDGEISPALDAGNHTWSAEFKPQGGGSFKRNGSFTIDQSFAYVYIDDPGQSSIEMGVGESRNFLGHVDGPESSEVNISSSNDNVAKFRASSFSYGFEGYIDAVGAGTATITVSFAGNKNFKAAESKTITVTVLAPATAFDVDWNNAKKTGSFNMPGGNVTLEPEYYPQAELATGGAPTAINDVPATTDGAIVKAGTVANIGETTTAQGTVMYYVSTTALDDAALLALAADAWTADVPTAAHLAAGQAYVYYYVRGNDSDTDEENFSDGDILAANALTVTIAAEPTYAVTFADDTAEPTLWTASPNAGVKKGQTVTVTYTGTKKVLGVKAEKKAAAPATVLSGALVDGAIIKVNFKWRGMNSGDYVQGVYNAASGTFTASKGGLDWGDDDRAVYKVEKSGDNIIIGAGFYNYTNEAMVWTFNTTNDTYTTTNGSKVNQFPEVYGLISVTLNGTDITSQLTAQ